MSRFPSSVLRPLVGATLSALLGLNASAQGMPQPGAPMAGPGMHAHAGAPGERMAAHQARRLDALKAKLQLQAGQEAPWNSFASVLQARPAMAEHMQQHQEMMRLSTPERLDRMKVLRSQHQAEMNAFMDRRAEATKAFYATLTPEQKKVFDEETARMMQGGRAGEGHHHPHHHGPQGRG